MKKAQGHGMVVIYLLTAIVVFLILSFGYTTIMEFNYRGLSGKMSELKSNIESEVTIISSQYGSIKYKVFEAPIILKKICFVETSAHPINYTGKHPLIKDSVISGAKENTFFIGKEIFESFFIGEIIINHVDEILCKDIQKNKISINFEGRGYAAVIY